MSEPRDPSSTDPHRQYPKISPAPNWTAIFTRNPELEPPGYAEAFIYTIENKRKTLRQIHAEEVQEKKKKKKLGRGQTN